MSNSYARADARQQLALGANHGPGAPRMFANGAQEYFDKYGGNVEHLAKIGGSHIDWLSVQWMKIF